ncbi:hypothetical protein BDV96DRAFT_101690 [Lophiotrema nucula]|uniref:DUF7730 domain-containing protein n=1 Tax=Lophiotrema nucula TaxID=690887 RepID=A0A6A5Z5A5_9PLEO|nr:hypothetical protein BDV96DRAFT_101690 [Lophiotrema nucula]
MPDKKEPIRSIRNLLTRAPQAGVFKDDPQSLPRRRARALSSTSPHQHSIWPRRRLTRDQMQSLFVIKLPLELRQACYIAALRDGAGTCHIYPADGRFAHVGCVQYGMQNHSSCWSVLKKFRDGVGTTLGGFSPDAKYWASYRNGQYVQSTSASCTGLCFNLLLTCRRIYIEAISLLYSSNMLSFQKGRALTLFVETILPQRFDAITCLSFNWTLDSLASNWALRYNSPAGGAGETVAWPNLCHRMSQMTHLRHLECTLAVWEPYSYIPRKRSFGPEQELDYLKPLSAIQQPCEFSVVLKWPEIPGSLLTEHHFPFKILRLDDTYLV